MNTSELDKRDSASTIIAQLVITIIPILIYALIFQSGDVISLTLTLLGGLYLRHVAIELDLDLKIKFFVMDRMKERAEMKKKRAKKTKITHR